MQSKSDILIFLRAWLSDPLRVGSAVPSSKQLAAMMVKDVDPARGLVLELGPGTGVFTNALVERGISPRDLTLVELGAEFADILAVRYPEATIVRSDAARLSPAKFATPRLHGTAISGLPLLSMSPFKILRILIGAFRLLDTDGKLYQFTYGLRCPVPSEVLHRLDLKADKVSTVFTNLPPASVYRICRI